MSMGNTSKDGTGTGYWLVVDSNGMLKVVGAAAHDAAAAGNPLRCGGVYHSTPPSVSDGDVVDLLVDAAGRLQTSATSSQVDDAAFTVGTSSITVMGGLADETGPDSVNEGDAGACRMSLDRMLLVQASGRAAEDAAVAGNPVHIGGRYDATARSLDDGDAGGVAVDVTGRLLVTESTDVLTVTLSLDTGGAYADGDVLAAVQEVTGGSLVSGGRIEIVSLVLLDKDDQAGALDIVFSNATINLGTENAAVNVSDADADKIVGVVEIVAGDYVDLVNSQIVTKTRNDLGIMAELAATSLWVSAISRDTKTYTASGITLKIGVRQL